MSHEKKAQSTGSWAGKRDKHQNLALQKKEKKHKPDKPKSEGASNFKPPKYR